MLPATPGSGGEGDVRTSVCGAAETSVMPESGGDGHDGARNRTGESTCGYRCMGRDVHVCGVYGDVRNARERRSETGPEAEPTGRQRCTKRLQSQRLQCVRVRWVS
jgi:hypothetical protein